MAIYVSLYSYALGMKPAATDRIGQFFPSKLSSLARASASGQAVAALALLPKADTVLLGATHSESGSKQQAIVRVRVSLVAGVAACLMDGSRPPPIAYGQGESAAPRRHIQQAQLE